MAVVTGKQQFNEMCRLAAAWLRDHHGFTRVGRWAAVHENDVRTTVRFVKQPWSSSKEVRFYVTLGFGLTVLDPGDIDVGGWDAVYNLGGPLPGKTVWPALTTEHPRPIEEFTHDEVVPAIERALQRYAPLRADPWTLYRTVRHDDEAMVQPLGLYPMSLVKRLEYAAVYAAALGADRDVDDIINELPQTAQNYGMPDVVPEILHTIGRARRGEFLRSRTS